MLDPMNVLALIPARGGSKGVARKNLRLVAGRSLLARSVETARRATHVERVVVTTDDDEIAAEAERAGARVIYRPFELAVDEATSESALLHALDELRTREGYEPEITAFLQCTAPLTLPRDVDGTLEALMAENADAAFAAVPFHGFLWSREDDGTVRAVDHDATQRLRRQERPSRYLEAGAAYAFRTDGFRRARHRFFGRTVIYPMPRERCLEIDTPADLERAGGHLIQQSAEELEAALPKPLRALVLDFDGVLTDNRVLVSSDGREAVTCHRGDGHGLSRLRESDVELLILSAETDSVVQARADKLGIPALSGQLDKHSVLAAWLDRKHISWEHTVFVGNDLPDVECLRAAGCGVAVADAHPKALQAARAVLSRPGGQGAVRELTDAALRRLGEAS